MSDIELARFLTSPNAERMDDAARITGMCETVPGLIDEIEALRAERDERITVLAKCLSLLESNVRHKARDDHAEQKLIMDLRQALKDKS